MKNQAGPGPLAPQAKPARPRTLGPPSQAGPAQDLWPPKPSRSGPGPLAPQAGPAQDPGSNGFICQWFCYVFRGFRRLPGPRFSIDSA